jgi:Mn-dependent DtxR family transcriptional regulator
MAGQMFLRVEEVAEELGVSKPYAYKLIRSMNEELRKTGCITILLSVKLKAPPSGILF